MTTPPDPAALERLLAEALETAATLMPVLHDMQSAMGRPAGQPDAEAAAYKIAAARTALLALLEDLRQTRALAERLAALLKRIEGGTFEPLPGGLRTYVAVALADARSAGLIETATEGT